VGPIADLDAVAKRKIPCSCRESNLSCPARSLLAILTAMYLLFFKFNCFNYTIRNALLPHNVFMAVKSAH